MKKVLAIVAIALFAAACQNDGQPKQSVQKQSAKTVNVPAFEADSAYKFVADQLHFGPRVPNTEAHVACGQYLEQKLRSYGAQVHVQATVLTAYNGTRLNARNIIGSFGADKKRRIALMAHWDTRPFADMETDPNLRKQPILGANDGASGVAVLLEIGRQISQQAPEVGIDLIFFDAEDYGTPRWETSKGNEVWCLGAQHWARNPHVPNYRAEYGILLDMVGAPGATFTREANSMHFAPSVVQKVWDTAHAIGYGNHFSYDKTPQIIDDHMFVNLIAGLPTIDIIQHDPATDTSFGSYWHTHNDKLDAVDPATLRAVGQTLLHVLYYE